MTSFTSTLIDTVKGIPVSVHWLFANLETQCRSVGSDWAPQFLLVLAAINESLHFGIEVTTARCCRKLMRLSQVLIAASAYCSIAEGHSWIDLLQEVK